MPARLKIPEDFLNDYGILGINNQAIGARFLLPLGIFLLYSLKRAMDFFGASSGNLGKAGFGGLLNNGLRLSYNMGGIENLQLNLFLLLNF